ncbi:MAG: Lar family restriction alleviation protein, partial [Bacteroidales bacterium]|nr:Lar family restriction alleviation protein [Bacteroidales bacterium]
HYAEEVRQLKSCPFCGSDAVIANEALEAYKTSYRDCDLRVEWKVGCSNDDCLLTCFKSPFRKQCRYWITKEGTLASVKGDTDGRQYVIEAWNRRANDEYL